MSTVAYDSLASLAAFQCLVSAQLICQAPRANSREGWNVSLELWRRLKARALSGSARTLSGIKPFADPSLNASFLPQNVLGYPYSADVCVKLVTPPDESGWSTLSVVGVGYRAVRQREAIVQAVIDTLRASNVGSVIGCYHTHIGAFELTTVGERAAHLPEQGTLTVTPVLFGPARRQRDCGHVPSAMPISSPRRLSLLVTDAAKDAARRAIISRFQQDVHLRSNGVRSALEAATKEELVEHCRQLGALRDLLRSAEREIGRVKVAAVHTHRSKEKGSERRSSKQQPVITLRGSSHFRLTDERVRLAIAAALIMEVGERRVATAHHVGLDERVEVLLAH